MAVPPTTPTSPSKQRRSHPPEPVYPPDPLACDPPAADNNDPIPDGSPISKQTLRVDESGRKVYGCTLCSFETKQKGGLKVWRNYNYVKYLRFLLCRCVCQVHINSVHYKMKVYKCDLCHFVSIQKGNLQAHMRTVHDKER